MHVGVLNRGKACIDSQVWARNQESMHARGLKRGKSRRSSPARVYKRGSAGGKSEVFCVKVGSAVAAKAGADEPGGGISLCFCRRGCAAPAQKAATLNDYRRSNRQKKDATKPTETATKPSGPLFIYNKGWPDGHPLLML